MILAKERYGYYDLEEEQNLKSKRKVKKVRKMKLNPRVFYITVVVLAFLIGLFLTSKYAELNMTGYRIVEMKRELAALQAENDRLKNKINKLSSLDRIERIATTKLGMEKPAESAGVQFIAVETSLPDDKEQNKKMADKKNYLQKQNSFLGALTAFLSNWTGRIAHEEATKK